MRITTLVPALLAASLIFTVSCTQPSAAEKAAVTSQPATAEASDSAAAAVIDSTATTPSNSGSSELIFGIPVDSYNIVTGKVRRNQFISTILASQGISWNTIEELLRVNRETFDPRRIRTGSTWSAFITKDTLSRADYFIYNHDPRVSYVFSLRDTLAIYRYDAKITRMLRYSSGTITTSLWETAMENGLNPNLSAELSEIYAWTIDFFGLQKGDRFKVIYEEEFIGEESAGIRRIHAALFEHSGNAIYAIPFFQDSTYSFYDTTGASLRKAFLKAPLRYSRISSRFSGARRHPILKIVRPHHGVDYAAPIGTPVVAIGDGRVTSTKYEGGSGRMVRITHNSVYSTAYLHLSRYGPGIAPGVYVKQGQVIGYVGSSGLSTGPHLDFRFYRNGSAVDPLRVEAPPVNPVAPESMEEFKKIAEGYIDLLSTISY
ncbi:MAG: peptidoglycan DD-metalloendopeptidase family protein [Bacteroidales bacterium]|nr:peptidoglycan DD-metalloendopeptidase family protein [Bacteroidales bacterium]MDT8373470.1 peptidoglycan DD-metalloendopeptidase family protein [Bacteroidales bacterium]